MEWWKPLEFEVGERVHVTKLTYGGASWFSKEQLVYIWRIDSGWMVHFSDEIRKDEDRILPIGFVWSELVHHFRKVVGQS